jgi:hypothetical protein
VRMTPFKESATYTVALSAPTATPYGELNVALRRAGLFTAPAEPLPAKVVTLPLGATRRILWLSESATSSESPHGTKLTGAQKRAVMELPSANPEAL